MPRKIRPVLQEMRAAIDGIETALVGKTFADFQRDWLLRHGVQRGIEIISEASRHLPAALLARHPARHCEARSRTPSDRQQDHRSQSR